MLHELLYDLLGLREYRETEEDREEYEVCLARLKAQRDPRDLPVAEARKRYGIISRHSTRPRDFIDGIFVVVALAYDSLMSLFSDAD